MVESFCEELLDNKNVRSNLIAMKQQLKADETEREVVANWEIEHNKLVEYLQHEDAKVRKNAALLLGEIGALTGLDELWTAYSKEQTLFVKSAYLLAMEKMDCDRYSDQLQETYQKLCTMEVKEEEKKHYQEEIKVLERILRKLEGSKKHCFEGYDHEVDVLLITNSKYREVTASQIRNGKTTLVPAGVKVKTTDIRELLAIRTYRELLFLFESVRHIAPEPERIADALCNSNLLQLLEELHKSPAPFYFRLNIRNQMEEKNRGAFIRKVAAAIEEKSGRMLINSADDYEVEIRLNASADGTLFPCVKLFTLPMKRFAYRKNAIAASIHPSTAALLMQLAQPYLKEKALVLDPFCGVGTMLLERDFLIQAGEMYGTDTFGEAILKARENAIAAGRNINFINRNIFDFKHRYLFDEIVTNMPVRVSNFKEEQDRFYARFFEKASQLLKQDGIVIMYSNESGFVKKQLRLRNDFSLKNEYCIREKSGYYLFIIRFKG